MHWSTLFHAPIILPNGDLLATLEDAGAYITKLPKEIHETTPWQTAMHVLIQAAEGTGPVEFARIGMLQALFPKGTPVYQSVDRDPKWRNTTARQRCPEAPFGVDCRKGPANWANLYRAY